MPEGLTQTKTPTSKTPAGFKSECRPVSFRNGGRLQIGTMAGFKSEYPAEINRNPHPQGMARSNRPEGLARQQAWRCRILHSEPMVISDALHARRQDADRQQSPGARYQNLCHWQKELAVQRHRRGSQGQCRRPQSDADLPRLTRRAVSLVAPRAHRIASARRRRRYHRPAALQLPQNRRCLNGSDAALDTKAIRQKRGRHRAEKIALTVSAVNHPE